MTIYNSQGYEVGNVLDKLTYPAARLKRSGPPPSSQPADFNPAALRGSPIRARPFAFHMREINGRALLALPSYVGPGLIKRMDVTIFATGNVNPEAHVNLFRDTSPYVTAQNLALTDLPHGTQVWETGIIDDQPGTFSAEGGLDTLGTQVAASSYVIDVYVQDTQFYLALVGHGNGASGISITGSLLVYEGIIPSDFPAILG